MHNYFTGLNFRWCESSRIVKCLLRIVKYVSCIIISRVLTSGGANRVESSSASDESTLVGCIGHVWRDCTYTVVHCGQRVESLKFISLPDSIVNITEQSLLIWKADTGNKVPF